MTDKMSAPPQGVDEEAMRLVDELHELKPVMPALRHQAAATLRRLAAENAALRAASGDAEAMRLERWGRSEGGRLLLERKEDGYWTPWHIADEAILRLAAENAALRAASAPAVPQGWDFCWLVELRPAFKGHPPFQATYYAGWMDGIEAAKTQDPMQAARFASKDSAERVAKKLDFTLSCIWQAVEHGFAASPQVAAPAAVKHHG